MISAAEVAMAAALHEAEEKEKVRKLATSLSTERFWASVRLADQSSTTSGKRDSRVGSN
jgi:hypothetical protein